MTKVVPDDFSEKAAPLAALVQELAPRGWFPATSSNFSARLASGVAVSVSGVHKDRLTDRHFLVVDLKGAVIAAPFGGRPSAETLLHTMLYERPEVGVVLHSHSVAATAVSMKRRGAGQVTFAGLEILKAFRDVTTHETEVAFPIFPNTQDIAALARDVAAYLKLHPKTFGYLIAGHGLYTWGRDIDEAKRHLEAFEFLLALELAS